MINNMDERILAELEIKKLEEMKTENKLCEIQLNKLNDWIMSITLQIADFDAHLSSVKEEESNNKEEVGNVDAPFQSREVKQDKDNTTKTAQPYNMDCLCSCLRCIHSRKASHIIDKGDQQ